MTVDKRKGKQMKTPRFIGDKPFYRRLLILLVPLVLQEAITNFVGLLDNIMVGRLGTAQISAVAIDTQLIFVLNLLIFGLVCGSSIYGSQFVGSGNEEGMKNTFRYKLVVTLSVTVLFVAGIFIFSDEVILLYMKSDANAVEDVELTLSYAKEYLYVMLPGLILFALTQVYSSSLKDTGETVTPMIASSIAVVINLIFNYLFIFGKFGFPELGVTGAAVATVISRFIETFFIIFRTHRRKERFAFIRGAYRSLRIPFSLVKNITITGLPLVCNELLWSLGTTFINMNYSTRGLDVVAAVQINTTVWNLFCVIMFAIGNAAAIMLGQRLGAGDIDGAKADSSRLFFFTVASHVVMGALLISTSGLIPQIYNVEPEVKALITKLIIIAGLSLPIHSMAHISYFTIRSGGKTLITLLFDSVYTWCIPVMISLFLCRFTSLSIPVIFFCVQFSDIIKVIIAIPMLKSGFWAQSVINKEGLSAEEMRVAK